MPRASGRRPKACSEGPDPLRALSGGSSEKRRRIIEILRRIAPAVPEDFVLATIGCVSTSTLFNVEELIAFDVEFRLDFTKLHAEFLRSGLWPQEISESTVLFSCEPLQLVGAALEAPLEQWQRPAPLTTGAPE